ncbi:hypothetical protein HNO91_12020 [Pseudomonas corrugata]|uniref:DnaT DNA-binding domain-containing protein n=1 Tax=Pseudomonas corrugata TaxID=47879 RepID=A0A7Y5Z4Y5_9PSED|nr:hypothetical protein [Pseudomonas corrugata]NUT87153.1 hypothetical protein [Pseudomonas corrugata]
MDWFRMYGEFATDPKVQMMSEADQRRFVMLLCLRCSNDDVTLHETEIAFQLRISNEEWATSKALFLSKGLIDEDCRPLAWDRRQFVSDSSAARVAAHRAKKKQACNVTVTPPDTDTEEDLKPPLSPLTENPAPTPEPKPKRKSRLPEPFNVSGDMRKWAADRAPAVHLINETEKFVNYWRGNGGTKADWIATWRNWLLKAQEDANRRMTAPHRTSNQPLDMTSTDWALEPIL